jgi:hypothetical protein
MNKLSEKNYHPSVMLQWFLIFIILHFGAVAAGGQELTPDAYKNFVTQTQALKAEKEARTPVQKKVNSAIIRHLHTKVLRDQVEKLPELKSHVVLNAKNEILVDIKANVSEALLALITKNGGTIINKFPQHRAIRALIPITSVEVIAAHPDVQFIDIAAEATLDKDTTSEGDVAHNAPLVRAKGYGGAGIKVGVISDSVDNLSTVQGTGDVGSVTVLEDSPGSSGEGTAMLEIIYDLAPGASLYFATANGGTANLANNIIALKDAGCRVIADDVTYSTESPFQDDIVSQAVNTVTAAGVIYCASAGNQGSVHAGTAGTWEGDFVGAGPKSLVGLEYSLSDVHAFATGATANRILTTGSNPRYLALYWSDQLGHSANDYDLYVIDSPTTGNVIDLSNDTQEGTQDPYEYIPVDSAGLDYRGYYVVIDKYSGDNRFLHLLAYRGRLQYATHGETRGHHTVDNAFTVAAVSAAGRTTAFTGSETLETFTSDGPRHIFYNPDGTAITPGNFSASGGRVRMKPDITAADGVACSTPGFSAFYGNSAAAPHAAAITALLLAARPNASRAQIFNALTKSALPSPAVWTEWGGFGIIMADRALSQLLQGKISSLYLLLD